MILRGVIRTIDRISELAGQIGKWFAVALVLIGSYETISRHFFNAPTIWAYDSLCMAGGALYLIGASYTYLKDSHTRVDLFYSKLSEKGQAIMDVVCALILFFPLISVMFMMAVEWFVKAVKVEEVMFNSFWYPPAAPYRMVFALGLLLLLLQGLAKLIRDVYFIVKGKKID